MTANQPKFRNSLGAALALHLLVPGLGHIYWREYLFGIFVFLVVLMAGALFVLSLFIELPLLAKLVIYGLPATFYLISFGDLVRTVRVSQVRRPQSARKAVFFLAFALLFEALWPLAPVNFAWQNAPVPFVLENNNLAPIFHEGDILKVSRLAYRVDTYFVDRPILHSLPERFTIVRVATASGPRCGIVIGLPGEDIEIVDGVVVALGSPQLQPSTTGRFVTGDWPLTDVGAYAILVAYPNLGRIEAMEEIPLYDLLGKVEKLL